MSSLPTPPATFPATLSPPPGGKPAGGLPNRDAAGRGECAAAPGCFSLSAAAAARSVSAAASSSPNSHHHASPSAVSPVKPPRSKSASPTLVMVWNARGEVSGSIPRRVPAFATSRARGPPRARRRSTRAASPATRRRRGRRTPAPCFPRRSRNGPCGDRGLASQVQTRPARLSRALFGARVSRRRRVSVRLRRSAPVGSRRRGRRVTAAIQDVHERVRVARDRVRVRVAQSPQVAAQLAVGRLPAEEQNAAVHDVARVPRPGLGATGTATARHSPVATSRTCRSFSHPCPSKPPNSRTLFPFGTRAATPKSRGVTPTRFALGNRSASARSTSTSWCPAPTRRRAALCPCARTARTGPCPPRPRCGTRAGRDRPSRRASGGTNARA